MPITTQEPSFRRSTSARALCAWALCACARCAWASSSPIGGSAAGRGWARRGGGECDAGSQLRARANPTALATSQVWGSCARLGVLPTSVMDVAAQQAPGDACRASLALRAPLGAMRCRVSVPAMTGPWPNSMPLAERPLCGLCLPHRCQFARAPLRARCPVGSLRGSLRGSSRGSLRGSSRGSSRSMNHAHLCVCAEAESTRFVPCEPTPASEAL